MLSAEPGAIEVVDLLATMLEADSADSLLQQATGMLSQLMDCRGVELSISPERSSTQGVTRGAPTFTVALNCHEQSRGELRLWRADDSPLTEGETALVQQLARFLAQAVRKFLRAEARELRRQEKALERRELLQELEQKRNEAQVHEERFDMILSSVGLGFWYCDLPLDHLRWNRQVKQHFGLSPDTEVTIELFFECLHPEDRDRVREAIESAIETGHPYDIEYRTCGPDGVQRWIRAIGGRFEGEPDRFDGITLDITRSKKVEAALREARDQALQANQLKSEFLANVSHEIRTPLVGLNGMVEFLRQTNLTSEQKDYVGTLHQCAETLRQVVDDVLALSRIEAGKLELRTVPCQLRGFLRHCHELFLARARENELDLVLQLDETLPEWVLADRNRLLQILSNLLSNAIKFTPAGSIWLRARRLPSDELQLEVEDTGIGIPVDRQEDLFQPFVQLDSSSSRQYGGTGLGLSIVRRLAELMGGRAYVESESGEGSRFVVELPCQPCQPPQLDSEKEEPLTSFRAGTRVLVAEDNPINRRVLSLQLSKLGYRVDTAGNGREALDSVRDAQPDLVLMDCQMPEMDGYEATRRLRSGEAGDPTLPIVALTAHALEGERERCLACGMNDYVTKPISVGRLDRLIQLWTRPPD